MVPRWPLLLLEGLLLKILTGDVSNDAAVLFGSGAAIFVTNVIVFGIWYREVDRGGPFARNAGERHPELSPPNWRPVFIDYLYVALTNVVASSPTDTMPLTRRAKIMMALQRWLPCPCWCSWSPAR